MIIKQQLRRACLFAAGMLACAVSWAQTGSDARLQSYTMSDGSTFRSISDNGKWAVAYGVDDASSSDAFPKLVNLSDKSVTELTAGLGVLSCLAADVTDDGWVAGSYLGVPAIWSPETQQWTTLPINKGCDQGRVAAITPDGRYAVGYCGKSANFLYEEPSMWDLSTQSLISLKGLPTVDLSGTNQQMLRLTGLSADARYLVGCMSYSYPQDVLYFLYDRENETFDALVFDYDAANKRYSAKNDSINSLADICISSNGKWVGGLLFTIDDVYTPFRYNTETKQIDYYLAPDDLDKGCVTVDNEGTLYASTPAMSPSRSLYIRKGAYWYAFDELLKQNYGIDYYTSTGYDATGLVIGVADNCREMVGMAYISQENYHLTLPVSFGEACATVNLLSNYSATPRNNASITKMSSVQVKFDRKVEVLGKTTDIAFKDANGNTIRQAAQFAADVSNATIVNISFRTQTLTEGMDYTITIPAGTICLQGDPSRTNNLIELHYQGYGTKALGMTSVSPETGSTLGQLDATTNPIVFSFDAMVKVAKDARANVYRNDETTPVAQLNIVAGNTADTYHQVMLYPNSTLLLYKGSEYRVELPAGSVTELSGNSANEAISVTYQGVYERNISSDNSHIYIENFASGLNNVILYDGDQLTPTSDMQAWSFTSNMPWSVACDDDYTNFCAVSHSMYVPSGKSDDWMVTPQLSIPDDKCRLTFDAQSYLTGKNDTLKVIVYATDEVINTLDAATAATFRSRGDLVFKERLLPGNSDATLAGDWQSYEIDLARYDGKKVYIAFVNDNDNQSAIFLTNVSVAHDADVELSLSDVETTQVAAMEQKVKGCLTIKNETATYTTLRLKLMDSDFNTIDEIVDQDVQLNKGAVYPFEFAKPLPLQSGKYNGLLVQAILNEGEVEFGIGVVIKNLAFQTTKRTLLEEMTGQSCQNCPKGHLALEKLETIYGDRFIPICYHIYTGDKLESGMTDYAQSFLGLTAAPSAVINRMSGAFMPMTSTTVNGVTDYSFTSAEKNLWLDVVNTEMAYAADADLDITASYEQDTDRMNVNYQFHSALDMDNAAIGLLCVVTEDGLMGFQSNNLYTINDDDLGEWQKGGAYGKSTVVPYTFNDVARALYPANNYYGQTGLLPATIASSEKYAGTIRFTMKDNASYVSDVANTKVTLLALNAATGELLNVARAQVEMTTGIQGVTATGTQFRLNCLGQQLQVKGEGDFLLSAYTADGRLLGSVEGHDAATLPLNYRGLIIIKVVGNGASMEQKVVVKP